MRRPASLTRAVVAPAVCATFAVVAIGLVAVTTAGAASSSGGTSGHRSFPGASGSVAAITGSSMEVQNAETGQTTVSWTTSTTFTQTVTVPASSVAVGDCVTASGSTSKSSKTVTAKTVTVSQPTTGKCTGGFARSGTGPGGFPGGSGGFPGGGARFAGGRPPSSLPAGAARRFASGAAGDFGFATGQVTAVSSSTLVLSGFSSGDFAAHPTKTKTKSKSARTTPKATTVKVTVNTSTTYSERQSAASSSVAVGDCVAATGSADSTGAVTAKAIQITSTGGQTCSSGFGAFGGAPAGG